MRSENTQTNKQNKSICLVIVLAASLFLLNACLPVSAQALSATSVSTPVWTMTMIPSATIDNAATIAALQADAHQAQEAARMAQLTSDAANRLLVDATITHEAIQYAYSQQTVTAEQAVLQYSSLTMQAGWISATAYATAFPATQTAQAKSDSIKITAMAMTINAPAQLLEMSAAETAAQFSWVTPFALSVSSLAVFVLAMTALIYVYRKMPPSVTRETNGTPNPLFGTDLLPIPMAPKQSAPSTTTRAEIPCTWPRLELLAKGIIREGKTLAKNQWEGTIVHRSIDALRQYFLDHEFAYELPGKRGELGMLEKGNHFLMYCVENGEPPSPHVCEMLPSPTV